MRQRSVTPAFPSRAPPTGRGALSNASGRFEALVRVGVDDGWHVAPEDGTGAPRTRWREDAARTLITTNDSPDLHFDRSINPYRGCEHGCIARTTPTSARACSAAARARRAIIRRRFELACRRAGIACGRRPVALDTTRFRPPIPGGQLSLF